MTVNIKNDLGNTRTRKPDMSSMVYGKIPPQDPEAEMAVLGAIMLDKSCLHTVLAKITSSDMFYVDAHQKIYEAIIQLNNTGNVVDMLTITDQLRKTDELELIGGAYYLATLTANVTSSAHVEHHAMIIIEKYLLREIIRICGKAVGDGYDDSNDPFDLLNVIDSELSNLQMNSIKKAVQHIGELSRAVTREKAEMRANKVVTTGISTGFETLDNVIGGWKPGKFVVLGARPAVGKTSFILNIADNAAPAPVGVFSLEMVYEELVQRMQAANTGIALKKIDVPVYMTDDEFNKYLQVDAVMNRKPIYIDDTSYMTFNELRAKTKVLVERYGVKIIIIDYLQLMQTDARAGNREQQVSKLSRDFKIMAKELEITVIALSQLNRDVEKRSNNKPTLADLRESGAIEQDADIIILMYRATKEEEKTTPMVKGPVNFNIAKNRGGDIDDIVLYFERETQKWHNSNPYPAYQSIPAQPVAPENHYRTLQPVIQKVNALANEMFTDTIQNQPPAPGGENIDDLPF